MTGNAMFAAVQISVIGMGLVFGSILVLWLAMLLLVRLTGESEPANSEGIAETDVLKLRAAAAAVSIALAEEASGKLHEFPLPPTALVSAWQLAMRSKTISRRGSTR